MLYTYFNKVLLNPKKVNVFYAIANEGIGYTIPYSF